MCRLCNRLDTAGNYPSYREDWVLENVVVVIGLVALIVSYRWFQFSRISYVLIAVFLALHGLGTHYTYSEVPYDAWSTKLTGHSINERFDWDRNHYDRLVHFLYGLLMTLPFREAFLHLARVRWVFWRYLFPFSFILSTSLIYELIEWAAAVVLGGEAGMAFLGTQGDIWDAHKDSFAAMIGALLASAVIAGFHAATVKDFARDWAQTQT